MLAALWGDFQPLFYAGTPETRTCTHAHIVKLYLTAWPRPVSSQATRAQHAAAVHRHSQAMGCVAARPYDATLDGGQADAAAGSAPAEPKTLLGSRAAASEEKREKHAVVSVGCVGGVASGLQGFGQQLRPPRQRVSFQNPPK